MAVRDMTGGLGLIGLTLLPFLLIFTMFMVAVTLLLPAPRRD